MTDTESRAAQLRARIVALGIDIEHFSNYLEGDELKEAVRAGKRALRDAEFELTDLLIAEVG